MEDPTRPTERIPPGQPPPAQPPPSESPPARETVHPYLPAPLQDDLRRMRFWSYFGSAVAVLASVLAALALVVAFTRDNNGDRATTNRQLEELRGDVNGLRSEVSRSRSDVGDAADQARQLSSRVKKLEQSTDTQAKIADDISQLKKDLTDLSDRVDQVEKAQEQAASGGP